MVTAEQTLIDNLQPISMKPLQVQFLFDFGSPNAYLCHKVLADVNRLRICRVLAEGPATVTELIDRVGLSQPLVSWHLSKLREVGLVSARRNGRETIHTIEPEAFAMFATRQAQALGLESARVRSGVDS